jgi:hypothetical protein
VKAKSGRKPKKLPTPLLQKWQRNILFEAIQAVGLNPRDFDLTDSGTEIQIKHKWSKSIFIIGGRPEIFFWTADGGTCGGPHSR